MPSLNSGTERPYAPLLEPCIILFSQYCAVGFFPLTVCAEKANWIRNKQDFYWRTPYYIARMLVSLGRWPPKK